MSEGEGYGGLPWGSPDRERSVPIDEQSGALIGLGDILRRASMRKYLAHGQMKKLLERCGYNSEHLRGRYEDDVAGLVPLPKKSLFLEEKPYEPHRFGEHG